MGCLPKDEGDTSGDCEGRPCADSGAGHRACFGGACGRPFLVDAEARVAGVVESAAWVDAALAGPRVDHLNAAERAELAAYWQRLGQMEHASIAAFARFNLQLLALGAPPSLVQACTRALADETEHTKLCFRLASAYADRTLGPGPLDIDGSMPSVVLADIVDLVIAEGCFGETSAALEALEAADSASDATVRAVYDKIASDEQRHAELAFQFLRWALERDAPTVRRRVAASIASPPSEHYATRAVIIPCLSAFLGRPQGFATRAVA